MTTPSKVIPGISLLLLLMTAEVSADTLLYDNGPDAFNFQATDFISFSAGVTQLVTNQVTDDFTLTAASTLDKVVFAELSLVPNGSASVPQFVNYAIGTTPFGTDAMGPHTAGGTAAPILTPTGTMQLTPAGSGEAHDYSASFGLPDIFLPAGTYYLTLDAATNTGPLANDYWSVTDATSGNAMARSIDGAISTSDLNNEPSFQIYGIVGAIPPNTAPEPGTWGLLMLGLLALALSRRRSLGSA